MKHNFGAGPGILPQEVLLEASQGVLDFNKSGLSILEISHRSTDFEAVLAEAISLVKELLEVPAGYQVLFLQGGASAQFSMVPFNLLDESNKAAYLDTGVWASKAIKESKLFGETVVVASSKATNYNTIPEGYTIPSDAAYFHITSNNTIYGTELLTYPDSPVPMVADMSSDMFSHAVDVSKFGIIYAGAQKNMGPAGTTLVIVREDILGKLSRKIPSMLDYKAHIDGGSMYNTPPVFAIYVSMLTLRWLKKRGGVNAIEIENIDKASRLYAEIDRNSLFKGSADSKYRSRMNVCFVTHNPDHEKPFLDFVKTKGIIGLKGHRSAGGFRASIYNALPVSSIEVLISAMKEFETLQK